jgi:outer membrane protein assembly factor BamE (lipoprotein component of BamABCDE complex)
MKNSRQKYGFAAVAITLLLSGCASLTGAEHPENVAKLEMGMTEPKVLHLLGNPDSVVQNGNSDRWIYEFRMAESQGHNVFVDFVDGVLTRSGELSGRDIAAAEEKRVSGTCTKWVRPEYRMESICTR